MVRRHQHFHKGFTLIELLVVILILGLLSTIATTSYLKAQKRARDNARKVDINAISTAIESYYQVKKSFPGMSSAAAGTATANAKNCVNQDAAKNFVYYYFPLDATYTGAVNVNKSPCNATTRGVLGGTHAATDFAPFPSWIPGLSDYINPLPVDKTYQGIDGLDTGAYGAVENASDASSTNKTRTYVYRHLNDGYAVYTRLENPDASDPSVYSGGSISDNPKLDSGNWSLSGSQNVYMVRK